MKSLKTLIAGCSLFASSMAMSQAIPLDPANGYFWIDGRTLTIAYSSLAAPVNVSNTTMLQVLADVEARLEGLNIPGLQVTIDTNVRNTGCSVRNPNEVLVCWTPVEGNTSTVLNIGGGSGVNFWREGNVMLDTVATMWTGADMLYSNTLHQVMHILGYGHPNGSGTSVLNGAPDLTQLDIDGLHAGYSASRCAVTYVGGDVVVPYVTYKGGAYKVTLRHNGGANFTLAPGSITAYGAANMPLTPCQSLAVDASDEVHFPNVNVGGFLYNATLRLNASGGLTLISSAPN